MMCFASCMTNETDVTGAHRITISLPGSVFRQFEEMAKDRGFENRSQAISEMITQQLADHHSQRGNALMAGTITLFYDHKKPGLAQQLSDISSLHVLLEQRNTMEVILVQGPARTLRQIANKLVACKGVSTGRLTLTGTVMPPIHAKQV